jgi:hypothetical protein
MPSTFDKNPLSPTDPAAAADRLTTAAEQFARVIAEAASVFDNLLTAIGPDGLDTPAELIRVLRQVRDHAADIQQAAGAVQAACGPALDLLTDAA